MRVRAFILFVNAIAILGIHSSHHCAIITSRIWKRACLVLHSYIVSQHIHFPVAEGGSWYCLFPLVHSPQIVPIFPHFGYLRVHSGPSIQYPRYLCLFHHRPWIPKLRQILHPLLSSHRIGRSSPPPSEDRFGRHNSRLADDIAQWTGMYPFREYFWKHQHLPMW